MLVIGGAAVMFCGQIIWDLLATWSIGPVPSGSNPMSSYRAGIQFMVAPVMMPFIETCAGQWLPIQLPVVC
jgi:hypothetical protein